MALLMLLHGIADDSLSMIQADQDTNVIFSTYTLSTSLYQLASRLGQRFAKRNNKDPEIYEAEALYVLVMLAHEGEQLTVKRLRQKITKELYKYMYADHTIAASGETNRKNKLANKENKTLMGSLSDVVLGFNRNLIERDRPIDFLEMLDDVCRTEKEKEYVRLVLEGHTTEEIAKITRSNMRFIWGLRSRIVSKLKEKI